MTIIFMFMVYILLIFILYFSYFTTKKKKNRKKIKQERKKNWKIAWNVTWHIMVYKIVNRMSKKKSKKALSLYFLFIIYIYIGMQFLFFYSSLFDNETRKVSSARCTFPSGRCTVTEPLHVRLSFWNFSRNKKNRGEKVKNYPNRIGGQKIHLIPSNRTKKKII